MQRSQQSSPDVRKECLAMFSRLGLKVNLDEVEEKKISEMHRSLSAIEEYTQTGERNFFMHSIHEIRQYVREQKGMYETFKKHDDLRTKLGTVYSSFEFLDKIGETLSNQKLRQTAMTGMLGAKAWQEGVALTKLFSQANSSHAKDVNQFFSIGSVATFASMGSAIGMASAAFSIVSMFSRKKKRQQPDPMLSMIMEGLRFLSGQLYEMHSEMRDSFGVTFIKLDVILNAVKTGFEKTYFLLHQNIDLLINISDVQARTEFYVKKIITTFMMQNLEIISLQPFRKLLDEAEDIIEERVITTDDKSVERIIAGLHHWAKEGGRLSLPSINRSNLLDKSGQLPPAHWINEIVFPSIDLGTVHDNFGFLASYARLLDPEFDEKVNVSTIVPPGLWCRAVEPYSSLRKTYKSFDRDPGNVCIDSMIEAGHNIRRFIFRVQYASKLYSKLFAQYDEALIKISDLIDASIQLHNAKKKEKMTAETGEKNIALNFADAIVDIIANFSKLKPRNEIVNGNQSKYLTMRGVTKARTIGQVRDPRCLYPIAENMKFSEIMNNNVINPEFSFLEALRLGDLRCSYHFETIRPDTTLYQKRFITISFCPKEQKDFKEIIKIEQELAPHQPIKEKMTRAVTEEELKDVRSKITDEIIKVRKEAISDIYSEEFRLKLKSEFEKLDASIRLLKAFLLLAGSKQLEVLNQLWSAEQVEERIKKLHAEMDEKALPKLTTLIPNSASVRKIFFGQITKRTNFSSLTETVVELHLNQLEMLRNIETHENAELNKDKRKNSTAQADTAMIRLKEIYNHYKEKIIIWSSDEYKIPDTKKETDLYKEFIKRKTMVTSLLKEANILFLSTSPKLENIIKILLSLNDNCRELHENLIYLAKGDYPFIATSFPFLESDRLELNKLIFQQKQPAGEAHSDKAAEDHSEREHVRGSRSGIFA